MAGRWTDEEIAESYRRAYDPAYGGTPHSEEDLAFIEAATKAFGQDFLRQED